MINKQARQSGFKSGVVVDPGLKSGVVMDPGLKCGVVVGPIRSTDGGT